MKLERIKSIYIYIHYAHAYKNDTARLNQTQVRLYSAET